MIIGRIFGMLQEKILVSIELNENKEHSQLPENDQEFHQGMMYQTTAWRARARDHVPLVSK